MFEDETGRQVQPLHMTMIITKTTTTKVHDRSSYIRTLFHVTQTETWILLSFHNIFWYSEMHPVRYTGSYTRGKAHIKLELNSINCNNVFIIKWSLYMFRLMMAITGRRPAFQRKHFPCSGLENRDYRPWESTALTTRYPLFILWKKNIVNTKKA
jgi:hypothetical protein